VKSVSIIGPNGQLGSDLVKVFQKANWTVNQLSHSEIQVEDIDSVKKILKQVNSDWIINTAAFHKVDECEKNSEKAWLINSIGSRNIAEVARDLQAKVVFISTDYVFSGDLPIGSSYSEKHPVSPVNVYGHSKAAGELATLSVDASNLIVRISSIFGAAGSSGKGKNFVETMISKAKNFESLTVVNDQHMSPTYTVDASTIILAAIQGGLNGKIHAANTGSTTWFNFTNEILKLTNLKADLLETSTDKEKRPLRPINSALDTSRIAEILKVGTSWQNALERYLHEKGHI